MGLLQELFRTHGPASLERFGSAIPKAHKKVIAAIAGCHTEAAGSALYVCDGCGQRHVVHRSCGNRHCPCCQQGKGQEWLERQRARQLPGEHFLLTVTVPEPLRPFLRRHQKIGYGALFEASSGAIKALVVDPRHIGGDVAGFFGVLLTWGRTLYNVMAKQTGDKTLGDLLDYVLQDEGRHVNFGYFALRRSIPELPEAPRQYLEDFALRACDAMYGRDERTGFMSIKHAYAELGYKDPDAVYAEVLATSMTMKMFNRFLFTEVLIPRLQRLGLISARVAPRYREIGLIE